MLIYNPNVESNAIDGGYYTVLEISSLDAKATAVSAEHSAAVDTACKSAVDADGQGQFE